METRETRSSDRLAERSKNRSEAKTNSQAGSHTSSGGRVAKIQLENYDLARSLFGIQDEHLRSIEKQLGVQIEARNVDITIRGPEFQVEIAEKLVWQLYNLLKKGHKVLPCDIGQAIRVLSADQSANINDLIDETFLIPNKNKLIIPKTQTQKLYMESIRDHDLTFGLGPAGTGKTYLAVAMAVMAFLKKRVGRIVLTRPAVEAGEKLGFLPGDMMEKVNPYLRPLFDALYDMLDAERVHRMIEEGLIEIAPLAFMRGRTLTNAFIILDEAQNCTTEQMKMFLTRLGQDSKAVVTGDATQIDLPSGKMSGLIEAQKILVGISDIPFTYFTDVDVVRHPLVAKIVKAYDQASTQNQRAGQNVPRIPLEVKAR